MKTFCRPANLILLLIPFLSGCVGARVYEDGRPVCALYGNYSKAYFKSPRGSVLHLENANHSEIVRETGNAVQKNLLMAAPAALTGL